MSDLYAQTARHPLRIKGSSEVLDANALISAITASMYSPESQWQALSEGLSAASRGDGGKLAEIAGSGASGAAAVRRVAAVSGSRHHR
ncbi:hypothetical protein ACGF13_29360 [Kitasatospora sp. NPDC048286]|uniref:hypothetical protein n=1 Tax=Kitasatospora sp. NPDC048286 TaxID=3364047 RepID=UPI00371A1ADD